MLHKLSIVYARAFRLKIFNLVYLQVTVSYWFGTICLSLRNPKPIWVGSKSRIWSGTKNIKDFQPIYQIPVTSIKPNWPNWKMKNFYTYVPITKVVPLGYAYYFALWPYLWPCGTSCSTLRVFIFTSLWKKLLVLH